MTAETPPEDWVLLEAAKRSGWYVWPIDTLRRFYLDGLPYHDGYRALCDMIEKYEKPPADRKVLCAREALSHTAFVYDPARNMVDEGERVCVRAIELWEEGFGK
jgi:hypothetical protein